jgi:hypothetical protein
MMEATRAPGQLEAPRARHLGAERLEPRGELGGVEVGRDVGLPGRRKGRRSRDLADVIGRQHAATHLQPWRDLGRGENLDVAVLLAHGEGLGRHDGQDSGDLDSAPGRRTEQAFDPAHLVFHVADVGVSDAADHECALRRPHRLPRVVAGRDDVDARGADDEVIDVRPAGRDGKRVDRHPRVAESREGLPHFYFADRGLVKSAGLIGEGRDAEDPRDESAARKGILRLEEFDDGALPGEIVGVGERRP